MSLLKSKKVKTEGILAAALCMMFAATGSTTVYAASTNSASQTTIQLMKSETPKTTTSAKPAQNIKVTLNGSPVTLSAPILNDNGSTLLPVRALGNLLGISINYDSNAKVAIASDEDTTLEIPIGYSFGVNNGVKAPIVGARSTLYNASTYLPVRYVSEQLGIKIDYKSESKTVAITTNATTAPTPTVTPTPQVQIPVSEPTLETPNGKGNDPNTIIRSGRDTEEVDPSYVQRFKSDAEMKALFPHKNPNSGYFDTSKVGYIKASMDLSMDDDFRLEGGDVYLFCNTLLLPAGCGDELYPATYVFKDGTTCDARKIDSTNFLPNGKTPKDIATIIYTKLPGVDIERAKGITYLVVILENTAK